MVEDLFMDEMYPRGNAEERQPKQYAFIEKARLTIAGEKKVDPFNFTPSVSPNTALSRTGQARDTSIHVLPTLELRQTQQY